MVLLAICGGGMPPVFSFRPYPFLDQNDDFPYSISDLTRKNVPAFQAKNNGKNLYPISNKQIKRAQWKSKILKIYTHFLTKTAQKTEPVGAAHDLYISI